MKAIIRKDEDAVSPVIATILMVAITVVLAAVLYVMVSGLITPAGNAPKTIGATLQRSNDQSNYVITFTSVPTGLTAGSVFLSINTGSGATNFTALALSSLGNKGITYQSVGGAVISGTALQANDKVLISATIFPTGYQVSMTSGGSIVYGPQTLQ